jgi:hypothetical protein
MTRAKTLETEKRWALPVAVASLLSAALMIGVRFVDQVSGTGAAEVLRSIDENRGSLTLSGLMQGLAFALLAFPLAYLFRAARVRSERVRGQLIGLVVAAPLFLALSTGCSVIAQQEAADHFVAGEATSTLSRAEAKEDCVADREDEGKEDFGNEFDPRPGETALAACEDRKVEDDEATEARNEASLAPLIVGLSLAGAIGLVVAFFYTCLWAMRTGLLTRFWGSLGMALGVATLFGLLPFLAIWLIYFGLLVLGRVPGGKPPAWEAGEAIPWPTPGEKAAGEMEPEEGWEEDSSSADASPGDATEKRKRKQRE